MNQSSKSDLSGDEEKVMLHVMNFARNTLIKTSVFKDLLSVCQRYAYERRMARKKDAES